MVVNDADKFYQEAIKNDKYDQNKLSDLNNAILDGKSAIENNDYSNISVLVDNIQTKLAAAKDGVEDVVDGQVLYLSFDNEDVSDESGRGNHGTSVGNVSYEQGVIGKALHIQNTNGRIYFDHIYHFLSLLDKIYLHHLLHIVNI